MSEIVKVESSLNDRMTYASALAKSDLLPSSYRNKPANVLLAMEYGLGLGLDTITAIQNVHVIDGKPTASAQLIGGLVRRAGHILRVTGTDTEAVAIIIRKDDPEFQFESVWTVERARAANLLGKGAWRTYPAAMLKARAITEVCRDACPEVLVGVSYTSEELGADEVVIETEVVSEPKSGIELVREVLANHKHAEQWERESAGEAEPYSQTAERYAEATRVDSGSQDMNQDVFTESGEFVEPCEHGNRRKTAGEKNGKEYVGYLCQATNTAVRCKPVWCVRSKSTGKWRLADAKSGA